MRRTLDLPREEALLDLFPRDGGPLSRLDTGEAALGLCHPGRLDLLEGAFFDGVREHGEQMQALGPQCGQQVYWEACERFIAVKGRPCVSDRSSVGVTLPWPNRGQRRDAFLPALCRMCAQLW